MVRRKGATAEAVRDRIELALYFRDSGLSWSRVRDVLRQRYAHLSDKTLQRTIQQAKQQEKNPESLSLREQAEKLGRKLNYIERETRQQSKGEDVSGSQHNASRRLEPSIELFDRDIALLKVKIQLEKVSQKGDRNEEKFTGPQEEGSSDTAFRLLDYLERKQGKSHVS